ncbi:MAG: hypothetical protein P4L64_00180 [Caulobacteraceae bacterium]|nr:hypothetical protein [Caulobacteraceae bacterium]
MSPKSLKQLNIDRFQGLLRSEIDPEKRDLILRLLAEERAKDEVDYVYMGPTAEVDGPEAPLGPGDGRLA